jgi:uncharacterized protein
MSRDKKIEREYSLNVARLGTGKHTDSFDIDSAFFQYFESPFAENGSATVRLEMEKYNTHLDVKFFLTGQVHLPCDRCGEQYPQVLDSDYRIIYSFDKELDFEGYEVMYVDPGEAHLKLMQEFYDIINLAIPIRKVPAKEVHLCAPEVLSILGLDENGEPLAQQKEEQMDPRWEALKKLKNKK